MDYPFFYLAGKLSLAAKTLLAYIRIFLRL
jgi:hypothetical protein